ncbi:MAG: sigma-70 family RNA polymerase sigma factor, partial [Planctomycetes bacterium]|nr:sigma-70 family RNA polymerase sigma factor [Planctomycetota bacterium]
MSRWHCHFRCLIRPCRKAADTSDRARDTLERQAGSSRTRSRVLGTICGHGARVDGIYPEPKMSRRRLMPVPPPPAVEVEVLLAQSGWMTALVRGLVADVDLADDVVQETWLRALRNRPRAPHGVPSLRRWLGTVARRIASRHAASETARRRREAAIVSAVQTRFAPEIYAERVRLQRELASHVLALDEPHRTAVILRYQEGLSPLEIARRTNISHAAARQRVSRGLARLRQRLERNHDGDRGGWIAVFAPLFADRGALPATAAAATAPKPFALALR